MKVTAQSLAAAAGSLFLIAVSAAEPQGQKPSSGKPVMEKCYGVVRTAKNDCHTATHGCAGQAKKDADPEEWLQVPKGTCERLVGGSLKPAK